MLDKLVRTLEMETKDDKKKQILVSMLSDTVTVLGTGVLRWIPRLVSLVAAYPSLSELMTLLCNLCRNYPEAVSRESSTILPALIRYAYHLSWTDPPQHFSSVTTALTSLVSTNPDKAKSLCHGMEALTVNPTFDALVRELQLCS